MGSRGCDDLMECHQNETGQNWAQDETGINTQAFFIKEEESKTHHHHQRVTWSNKAEYFLSVLGYCVGLGNFWRFPYICIRNGGGAFWIPYLIFLVSCGIPLFLIEVAMGQFMSRGAYHIWSICPLLKGIGIGEIIISAITTWYYFMIISWIVIYLVHSFRTPLPWTLCGQSWNTPDCVPPGAGVHHNVTQDTLTISYDNSSVEDHQNLDNGLWVNVTNVTHVQRPSGQEFWLYNVLELSSGLEDLNGLPWHTTLALFISCLLVFLCMIRGIKSVGKVVYVTATFPYVLLLVLIVKGLTLPGAVDGVKFYIKPDLSKLSLVQTWLEASIQVLYSLCITCGTLATLSSYNKFQNNCVRDVLYLCCLCEVTSFLAGLSIFTVLGHMAYNLKVPVENFTTSGSGLAFVVYPEAVSYLPLPQLWAVLFFLMMFTVIMDTLFGFIEVVLTFCLDIWPEFMRKWGTIMKIVYGSVLFLFGLSLSSRGGFYLLQLMDWYIVSIGIYIIGFLECIAVAWIYGSERFTDDIEFMTGRRPPFIFSILWKYVTPVLLLILLVTSLLSYTAPEVEGYQYSDGAVAFGWIVAIIWVLPVPVVAVGQLVVASGDFSTRLKKTCTSSIEWQPNDVSLRVSYRQKTRPPDLCEWPRPFCLSVENE